MNLHIRLAGQSGGGELSQEFHPGLESDGVVEEAGGEGNEHGRRES